MATVKNTTAKKSTVKSTTAKKATTSKGRKISTKNVKTKSNYRENVLNANAEFKKQSKSLGYCMKVLNSNAKEIELNKDFQKILQRVIKGHGYNEFKSLVRTSKNGNYSPFYVLQALNKNLVELKKFHNLK